MDSLPPILNERTVPPDHILEAHVLTRASLSVRPITIATGTFYLFLTLAHTVLLPAPINAIMATIAGLSAALMFTIFVAFRSNVSLAKRSHELIELAVIVPFINSAAHLWLTHDPIQSTNLMIVMVAACLVVWRRLAFWAITSLIVCSYIITAVTSAPSHLWTHFGFGLAATWVVAMINFHVRWQNLIITESLRYAEEQSRNMLAHSARLASLGEMAGGIAHEINNPLAIISGWANVFQRMKNKGIMDAELVSKGSDVMVKTCGRIAAIIRGLQLATHRTDNRPCESIQARTLMEDINGVCATRFKLASVKLDLPDLVDDLRVWGRPQHTHQILLHLMNNAYDAVQGTPDAWVTVRASTIIAHNRMHVRFDVQNSGPPIAPEVHAKLFTPFFTTKQQSQGVGLGLAISRGLAEGMGGSLQLVADQRHTTFRFTLVASKGAKKADVA